MNLTQKQIEALKKGETIEIKKEWVETKCKNSQYGIHCSCDKFQYNYCCECKQPFKIPKYKVGDIIGIKKQFTFDRLTKLKILPFESETKWKVCLV